MLTIRKIEPSDLTVSVEVDFYVPIKARTYSEPFGAVFYLVGNFNTSLVEVAVDPSSGTIRGLTLVLADRLGAATAEVALTVVPGLPVASQVSIPDRYARDHREVEVALVGDRLFIDWSEGRQADTKAVHGRISFLIGDSALLGAVIETLTNAELEVLTPHIAKWRNRPNVAT